MMKYIGLMLISLAFLSCDKKDSDLVCYGFDIRQCQTDSFANDVPEGDNEASRELKMKVWLEAQGLQVDEIDLQLNYYDSVCEACDICPQGDRYFVKFVSTEDFEIPSSLNLLNLALEFCEEHF